MTTKRRKRHNPEQIVCKLRDADAMLNVGKEVAAVLQALEISQYPSSVQTIRLIANRVEHVSAFSASWF